MKINNKTSFGFSVNNKEYLVIGNPDKFMIQIVENHIKQGREVYRKLQKSIYDGLYKDWLNNEVEHFIERVEREVQRMNKLYEGRNAESSSKT